MLKDTSFAVVDVETTGFSPLKGDRIVEVAVVRLYPDTTEGSLQKIANVYKSRSSGVEDVAQAYVNDAAGFGIEVDLGKVSPKAALDGCLTALRTGLYRERKAEAKKWAPWGERELWFFYWDQLLLSQRDS